ncbi:MAG: PIN domain-containing protein [Acidimicrobiales bacterium]
MIFVDTSALFALVDDDDDAHRAAMGYLDTPGSPGRHLTHSYVLCECMALAQRRLGIGAVRALDRLVEAVEVVWVDQSLHQVGMSAVLAGPHRGPSLVDQVSFEVMRRRGIDTAFAFDADFTAAGFTTVPSD